MTIAHYLSLPYPSSGTYERISKTLIPFGSNDGALQNLDARIYFSASTYIPASVGETAIIPALAQSLFQTEDWFIGIDPEGRATFGVKNFYALTKEQWLQDCWPNPTVWNPWAMSVTSTVQIPTFNSSPDGLFLRVYVNAYGGSGNYPGASTSPCVVFFTSPDAGATFVQIGVPVPLPPRTTPYDSGTFEQNNMLGAGPYVELQGGYPSSANNLYLAGPLNGALGSTGISLNTLPDMRVYKYSLQNSYAQSLCNYDFTSGSSLAVVAPSLVAFGGAVLV
ncbi:hypothetical protein HN018_02875 [Lichenicola cladoniae]|uniref:Uncharacterized protein n=1 Tax=Lichenicola cladoniae TaxID=1484109 RepID=A0A6M8HLB0_9PROT|nr:hypothetical protein [Lichenicola cladoniae]NPD68922.1 hypothetical protein [Acetobacteraceae bacterium]QKE89132.1 hypothetical protein HN018_02875 [Lichenicola cladoniae]